MVLAHRNAPKIVCKFQLAHLLVPEAIFGALMTEIRDSHNFEGKMLKPRKPLNKRSRVIILFYMITDGPNFDTLYAPY